MSKRTPSDIICSDECNTYVMSCHLNRDELYKAMRDDIAMMCKEYATLKAQRDELLAAAKAFMALALCYRMDVVPDIDLANFDSLLTV